MLSYIRNIKISLLVMLLILVIVVSTGCSQVTPWVKPYERSNLAEPVMSFSRDPVSSSYINHVYQAREGARGAENGQGGGCGCN